MSGDITNCKISRKEARNAQNRAKYTIKLLDAVVSYGLKAAAAESDQASEEDMEAFSNAEDRLIIRAQALSQSTFSLEDRARLGQEERVAIAAVASYVKAIGCHPYSSVDEQRTKEAYSNLQEVEAKLRDAAQGLYRRGWGRGPKSAETKDGLPRQRVARKKNAQSKPLTETQP